MTTPERALPHRAPMLLVDVIDELGADRVVTRHAVLATAPCFTPAAAPEQLVYPPALVLESFVQSGAILAGHTAAGQLPVFVAARDVTFHQGVVAGDMLVHEVVRERALGDAILLSGRTTCDGSLVASYGSVTATLRSGDVLAPA